MEAGTSKPQILSATHVLDKTACATHLRIKIQLSRVTTMTMIDSGATRNFMSIEFKRKSNPWSEKSDPY